MTCFSISYQKQTVQFHKELLDELSAKGPEVKKTINSISELPAEQKKIFAAEVDHMVAEAKERLAETQADLAKINKMEEKLKQAKPETTMTREEIMAKLSQQLNLILSPDQSDGAGKPPSQSETPKTGPQSPTKIPESPKLTKTEPQKPKPPEKPKPNKK
ncbi:hypothetical protein GE061_013822 [Apolygus lucorum]|uniref:Uncharacterized protein n=1 Tax=Apolygus lucorum TaxID=248454 RepID=A0A8S9XSX8_APOLU|nr:hypothetical protein GE061_013822 [Apolygus lucorum]